LCLRFFQNATLQPVRLRVPIIYATFNRWLLTGNTRSKCFHVQTGGFFVSFSGDQILKGTYGGEEGIDTPSNTNLAYLYNSISVPPPCEPIVIKLRSSRPNELRPPNQTGITVVFYELSHPTLGQGAAQGLMQVERFTAANGTSFFRMSTVATYTFPPNVLTF